MSSPVYLGTPHLPCMSCLALSKVFLRESPACWRDEQEPMLLVAQLLLVVMYEKHFLCYIGKDF